MVKKCPICNKPLDSLPENHSCSGFPHKGNIQDWIIEEEKFRDKQPEMEVDYQHEKEKKMKREKKRKHDRRDNYYGGRIKHSWGSKLKNRWDFYKSKFRRKRHFRTGTSGRIILALFVPLIVGLAIIYFLEPGLSLLFQYY